MANVIILHAMADTPNDYWYPWLKSELQKKNYKVWVPELPDSHDPRIDKWIPFIIKNGIFNENTIIVGHSAGAAAILAVLEELEAKIDQAILISGFSFYPGGDGILKPSYNWEKIKNNVNEMIFINSDNDPYGHDDVDGRIMLEMLNMDGASQIIIKGQGHMGTHEFIRNTKNFHYY